MLVVLFCLQAAGFGGAFAWAQSPTPSGSDQTTLAPQSYSVTDLGVLSENGFGSHAVINDKGQVVGGGYTASFAEHPFLWQNGKATDLGTLGGNTGWATAINNEGQVVGESETGHNSDSHAFLWQNGHMTDLGTLGGNRSYASAINDKGQVVGASTTTTDPNAPEHAFLWQDGQMRDIGDLGIATGGVAYGINNEGQVVGWSGGDAFLWQNGQMTDIGIAGRATTVAVAINLSGQVTGFSAAMAQQDYRAFFWQNGKTTDLGAGYGESINDKGQVVGSSTTATDGSGRPFLWQEGKLTDLNTLIPPTSGVHLNDGFAINNAGQIIALADLPTLRAYLLTPVHTVDATLQLSLPSWQFAAHQIGQTSGPGIIWAYNSGTDAATFSSVHFTGANAQDFAITENTCGSTLAPFTTCKVVFHFTPTAGGERNASLTLTGNAVGNPQIIPVQGFGSSE